MKMLERLTPSHIINLNRWNAMISFLNPMMDHLNDSDVKYRKRLSLFKWIEN